MEVTVLIPVFALITQKTDEIRTYCCRCGELLYCQKNRTLPYPLTDLYNTFDIVDKLWTLYVKKQFSKRKKSRN